MALTNKLKAIADAIRGKTGKTEELTLDQMATEIEDISGGDYMRDIVENGFPNAIYSETAESVGNSAFDGVAKIQTVDLPNVKTLGYDAFIDCNRLRIVNLPSAETIGEIAFANDTNLETVNIPMAKRIDRMAFRNCSSLKEIVLPSVENIASYAFEVSGLEKVTLGKATATLGADSLCSGSLTAIILTDTVGMITDVYGFLSAFGSTAEINPLLQGKCFVYVPASMYSTYEYALTAYDMTEYLAMFRRMEDYPEICG